MLTTAHIGRYHFSPGTSTSTSPSASNGGPVQRRHSDSEPATSHEAGATPRMRPPARTCVSKQGSDGGRRLKLSGLAVDCRAAPGCWTRILRARGMTVITLITGARHVLDTVVRCLRTLGGAYDVLFARQPHHNRQEATVLLRGHLADNASEHRLR